MGANKLENFDIEVVHRSLVVEADYNPRKIGDDAKSKLKKFLKKNGLWSPLVWNRQTQNLVSGHQRIGLMDTLLGTSDYELTMSVVDVDEQTEVKGNVFFNNPSAQGDWDFEILGQLGELYPDLDYVNDLGFDQAEVDMFISPEIAADAAAAFDNIDVSGAAVTVTDKPDLSEDEKQEFRDAKKKAREQAKLDNLDGSGYSFTDSDFTVTVIFPSADKKRAFMELLEEPPKAKRITAESLLKMLED